MKQQLSNEQESIVNEWTANGRAMIVRASAGSGKTRVLTESVRKLIAENPYERFRVLCLTFTVKAANEMAERLEGIDKKRVVINNLHAFALTILEAYKNELGYKEMPHIVEREDDRKVILKEIINEHPKLQENFNTLPNGYNKSLATYQRDLLYKILIGISEAKRNLEIIDDETFEKDGWDEDGIYLYKSYNDELRNQDLIDFDDILLLAWKILMEKPFIAKNYQRLYKYVLIDEGQDLNHAQYEFIKVFCGETIKNILMVGDNKQAINGYAGADKKYMFEYFKHDFNAVEKEIEFNYRSSKKILEVANTIIPNNQIPNNQKFEGNVEIKVFENETTEAQWIISKIKEALTWNTEEFEGQVSLDKIAILARNRFVFNELIKNLEQDEDFKNHFFLKKGTDVLSPESTFMKIFDLGTRIVTNPNGKVYLNGLYKILKLKNIVLNGLAKADGLTILKYLKEYLSDKTPINENDYDILLKSWEKLNQSARHFKDILDNLELHIQNAEKEEEEKNYAILDIQEWKTAWKTYLTNSSSSNKNLADFKRFAALGFAKQQKEQGLTLATVHTTKGLEYDIVFLMGMCEGTFPDYRAKTDKEKLEERNSAYVAVTRAKRHIYISYPKNKMMPWGNTKRQNISEFVKPVFEGELVGVL